MPFVREISEPSVLDYDDYLTARSLRCDLVPTRPFIKEQKMELEKKCESSELNETMIVELRNKHDQELKEMDEEILKLNQLEEIEPKEIIKIDQNIEKAKKLKGVHTKKEEELRKKREVELELKKQREQELKRLHRMKLDAEKLMQRQQLHEMKKEEQRKRHEQEMEKEREHKRELKEECERRKLQLIQKQEEELQQLEKQVEEELKLKTRLREQEREKEREQLEKELKQERELERQKKAADGPISSYFDDELEEEVTIGGSSLTINVLKNTNIRQNRRWSLIPQKKSKLY